MADEPLLTVRQVADELGLPESTVRYYRDAFLEHIPVVGMGRRRRYPPPAVAVLRAVAQGYAEGRTYRQILAGLDGSGGADAPAAAPSVPPRARRGNGRLDEVTNLELLAAIVDGEREQRDALWQMAGEIVRLTGVLESQERALAEIAGHAGLPAPPALARPGRPALGDGAPRPAAAGAASGSAPPSGDAAAAPEDARPVPLFGRTPLPLEERPPSPPPGPAGEAAANAVLASELERLRDALESERELVERLREAKLRLEQRATGAEAELEERRRKGSVLGRILKPGERA